MIDAKELRLGNLVQTPKWIGGIESVSIGSAWVGTEKGSNLFDHDDLCPIPITPEWLERLGFEYDQIAHYKSPLTMSGDCGNYGVFIGSISGGLLSKNIKYIHQLQNLYFALTGQELTIKAA